MKLVTIFDDRIWSVVYDDSIEDAFNDEFDRWHNAEYVYNYILENIDSKNNSPWRKYSAKELTVMVKNEAIMFESRLEKLYINGFKDFDNEFVNLSNNVYEIQLIESKAYGKPIELKPSILRLYAIRIEKDKYVITGGGIKFVREMKDSKDLTKELDKLRIVKQWLKDNGIHISNDIDTLTEDY
ncbi:MAG: hypothetical protein J6U22_04910 [Bacteroidaceae bacterium]|nr:hypothetical protein [Bacteroidaceae bacterium]